VASLQKEFCSGESVTTRQSELEYHREQGQ